MIPEGDRYAVLTRDLKISGDDGTFGHIVTDEHEGVVVKACSGELPNRGNVHDLSDIPARPGNPYLVEDAWSEKHQKNVWHIRGVEGRDVIEIHSGNLCGDVTKDYASDILGCQLYGDTIALFRQGEVVEGHHLKKDQRGVTNTVATLAKLRAHLGPKFWLEIKEA